MVCRSHVAIGGIDANAGYLPLREVVEIWGLRGRRQVENMTTQARVCRFGSADSDD